MILNHDRILNSFFLLFFFRAISEIHFIYAKFNFNVKYTKENGLFFGVNMAKASGKLFKIKYIQGNQNLIDEIKVLWEDLNRLMSERSIHFKNHFLAMTFEKRKTEILEKVSCGEIHIDLAVNELTGNSAGYIVSSIDTKKTGIIESVYVAETYRGIGIGDNLMKNALAWLDEKNAKVKILDVTVGNENVYSFYSRYGFLPRQTQLKQVK